MSKLEKAIDKLEQEVECDDCLVLINALRKAIEQRDSNELECTCANPTTPDFNKRKTKLDAKILKILEGE